MSTEIRYTYLATPIGALLGGLAIKRALLEFERGAGRLFADAWDSLGATLG